MNGMDWFCYDWCMVIEVVSDFIIAIYKVIKFFRWISYKRGMFNVVKEFINVDGGYATEGAKSDWFWRWRCDAE